MLVVTTKANPLNEASAHAALIEACGRAKISCDDAALIRIGSNALYRLPNSIIARIARSRDLEDAVRREVDVSNWLRSAGVPAIQVLDIDQPILTADRVVTFWKSLGDDAAFGTTVDLARLLKALHALDPQVNLPKHYPTARIDERLSALGWLDENDRHFMAERAHYLTAAYEGLTYDLPTGAIHGDANVGNVLVDQNGVATLADLDGFCCGAREWDLILTALYFERYGWHTEHEYMLFVETYGYDIRSWRGYEVLSDVREFLMLTWLGQNVESNAEAAREFRKRIHALRTGGSRQDWLPL